MCILLLYLFPPYHCRARWISKALKTKVNSAMDVKTQFTVQAVNEHSSILKFRTTCVSLIWRDRIGLKWERVFVISS